MTIRTRMTLWYSAGLLLSILVIGVLALDELYEPKGPSAQYSQGMQDYVGIVLWIGIPTVILSLGGGWWLMRKCLAPVSTLTEAAKRVTEHNLDTALPRTGNGDELDQLTAVLNAMTERLHQSFTRVRNFTLAASHELKTPLTILCAETETELHDESLAPAQRERFASRLDELHRLARIVDGLTLLAKADAGLVTLTLKPIRFDELVRDSFADLQVLAQASGLRVELAACEPVAVQGDAHRLRQLLLNLADNAVKYNQPGGFIRMALRRRGDAAEFTLANTGSGIAPEALPRVFDRFFRGDPAHGHEVDGCGLGLSIAQWIASAHHGLLRLESVPLQLTTATLRLPFPRGEA